MFDFENLQKKNHHRGKKDKEIIKIQSQKNCKFLK